MIAASWMRYGERNINNPPEKMKPNVARSSDFGTFDLENVRAWPKTVEIRVRVDFEMAELSAGNRFPSPARGEWSEEPVRIVDVRAHLMYANCFS